MQFLVFCFSILRVHWQGEEEKQNQTIFTSECAYKYSCHRRRRFFEKGNPQGKKSVFSLFKYPFILL
jgi:hypothetical protein